MKEYGKCRIKWPWIQQVLYLDRMERRFYHFKNCKWIIINIIMNILIKINILI